MNQLARDFPVSFKANSLIAAPGTVLAAPQCQLVIGA
jgi:hypothetical protein